MQTEAQQEAQRRYRQRHREELNAKARTTRTPDTRKAVFDRWYATHREAWLAARRARYAADPMPHRERAIRWGEENPDKIRANYERFQANNPEYSRWHYSSTPQRQTVHKLCKALHSALLHREGGRDWYPSSKIGKLIGCSKPDLIAHIEAQFTRGMSWANYGRHGWWIDHIKPCATFDLTKPKQQRACFNYLNLRPLWRTDNLRRPRKE
jgi:hypothetical protein